jgi:hypothetical protein
MANPIYNTTDSNSGKTTTETHSPGDLTGSLDLGRAGMAAEYKEIPSMGTTGPKVPEFPSKNA